MSWDEYHRKTAALDAVLVRAAETGRSDLPYGDVPGVSAVFASEADLLSALEAKWSTLYRGFLEQEAFAGERTGASPAEIARSARLRVDVVQPDLRRLIDHNTLHRVSSPIGSEVDVPLEAAGIGGLPFPTWTATVRDTTDPRGVGAEIATLVLLFLFGFALWSL